jgi:hypothetical protein
MGSVPFDTTSTLAKLHIEDLQREAARFRRVPNARKERPVRKKVFARGLQRAPAG